jgi:hypothetical protein
MNESVFLTASTSGNKTKLKTRDRARKTFRLILFITAVLRSVDDSSEGERVMAQSRLWQQVKGVSRTPERMRVRGRGVHGLELITDYEVAPVLLLKRNIFRKQISEKYDHWPNAPSKRFSSSGLVTCRRLLFFRRC